MEHQRNAVVREGMKQHLRYLQDIPHDQRTRRHAMQIEHYLLADKCIETIEKSNCAMSQGEPLHVAAARLGDPATYHAMLARIFFLSQSPYKHRDRSGTSISTLWPWVPRVIMGDESDATSHSILPPEEALRSEPGIMRGEPSAVLKAVALEIILGPTADHDLMNITLLRSAIAGLEANEDSRKSLDTFLREVQPDFSAEDLLWVLYILYSQRSLRYITNVTPWDEQLGALAHARQCITKACELRPTLPYGFEAAALFFHNSRMLDLSFSYAEKGLRLARELKDDYSVCSMANYLSRALILGGRLPFTLGEVKALRIEADEASLRAKKYIPKLSLAYFQPIQQLVDKTTDTFSRAFDNDAPISKALASMWPTTQQSVPGSDRFTPSVELQRFKCSNCGLARDYLKKCSACASVSYCSKECQLQHWKAGHKRDCKK